MLANEEIKDALKNARVPVSFHDPKALLGNCGPKGVILSDWIKSREAAKDIRKGIAKFFVGTTPHASDTFFTLARSLVITAVSTKVYSLPRLIKAIEEDDEKEMESIAATSSLMVLGFYEPKYKDAIPAGTLFELEWFFRSRWSNNLANIFLSARPPHECEWWGDSFIFMLQKMNPDIVHLDL